MLQLAADTHPPSNGDIPLSILRCPAWGPPQMQGQVRIRPALALAFGLSWGGGGLLLERRVGACRLIVARRELPAPPRPSSGILALAEGHMTGERLRRCEAPRADVTIVRCFGSFSWTSRRWRRGFRRPNELCWVGAALVLAGNVPSVALGRLECAREAPKQHSLTLPDRHLNLRGVGRRRAGVSGFTVGCRVWVMIGGGVRVRIRFDSLQFGSRMTR